MPVVTHVFDTDNMLALYTQAANKGRLYNEAPFAQLMLLLGAKLFSNAHIEVFFSNVYNGI